jgi:hypothetical protein
MYKFNCEKEFKYSVDSNGEYHSFDDQPAIEYLNGNKIWMKNGVMHRCQYLGPAFQSNIKMEYYMNGKLHCDYGPAVIEISEKYPNRARCLYYINGVYKNEKKLDKEAGKLYYSCINDNGLSTTCNRIVDDIISSVNIYKENNQLHRIDGPAFEVIQTANIYREKGRKLQIVEFKTFVYKSIYFYKNKQIDMSKITIFNENDTVVIYGVNYLLVLGQPSDKTNILCVNYKEKKIKYDTDINLLKTTYANKALMSFEKYILGLTLQQICDQNTWTTFNLMLNVNGGLPHPVNNIIIIEEPSNDIDELPNDIDEPQDESVNIKFRSNCIECECGQKYTHENNYYKHRDTCSKHISPVASMRGRGRVAIS